MESAEIGFAELLKLVQRHRWLILGLAALSGLLALVAVTTFSPVVYQATAKLVVLPVDGDPVEPAALYHALLTSDRILGLATESLIGEGVLPAGATLEMESNLFTEFDVTSKGGSVLRLIGSGRSPEQATDIVNTWARTFVEESGSMLAGSAFEEKQLLDEQLTPVRQQLEDLESQAARVVEEYQERESRVLEQFQKREEETSTRWDRRISETKKKAELNLASYHTRTRNLMEETVERHLSSTARTEMPAGIRAKLEEIVSVRAQLTKTPRVMALEKAASDETLAERLLETGRVADYLDSTLVTEEMNPLHDRLSVDVLRLESELKRAAGTRLAGISAILVELETIQLERAAGLTALQDEGNLELRIQRRQRSYALQDLQREKSIALAEIERTKDQVLADLELKLGQIKDLEHNLKLRMNTAVISGLLDQVSAVKLAAPAVPSKRVKPRRAPVKIVFAMILGGTLGLVIALFRPPGA